MRVYSTRTNASVPMSYVSEDGNYGSDELVAFPYDLLTDEQWNILSECSDSDRINYVKAIINGDDLSEWQD
jgi:hypothetical protein